MSITAYGINLGSESGLKLGTGLARITAWGRGSRESRRTRGISAGMEASVAGFQT